MRLARTSSATSRNAASSPVVNWLASRGGIGPDAASVRRRSIDARRSGERCCLRLGGKWLNRPCAFASAATCGARCATVSIPRTSRLRASIASASACACSSVTSLPPNRCQTARANPSSVARDFVPPIAVNNFNIGHSFAVRVDH